MGGAGYATPTSDFSAEVKLRKGSGIYPYATVIDSETGDAIVVTLRELVWRFVTLDLIGYRTGGMRA